MKSQKNKQNNSKKNINQNKAKVLLQIALLGGLYENDLTMYAIQFVSKNTVVKILQELIEDDLILENEISNPAKKALIYKYYTATKKGKQVLIDYLNDDDLYKYINEYGTEIKTSNITLKRKALLQNRIINYLTCCNVKAMPYNKPSLYHLYFTLALNPNSAYDSSKDFNKIYTDNFITKDEIENDLASNGYYYTSVEFKRFLSDLVPNNEADNFNSSMMQGIYISKDKVLAVYALKRGEAKLIKLNLAIEERMIASLNFLNQITDAYRHIQMFDGKSKTSNGEHILLKRGYSAPQALVFCDRENSAVYTMCNGYSYGRTKKINSNKAYSETRENISWLKGKSNLYERIYVAPVSLKYLKQLKYLLHTSIEQYYDDLQSISSNRNDMLYLEYDNTTNPKYPLIQIKNQEGQPKNATIIFMPTFEIKELYKIQKDTLGSYAIITKPDMVDAINHCIQRSVDFYDYAVKVTDDDVIFTITPIDKNTMTIYDEYGFPKGIHELELELAASKFKIRNADINKVRLSLNMSVIEFNNKLINDPDFKNSIYKEFLRLANPITAKKKSKPTVISFQVDNEFSEIIKTAAKRYDMSTSHYIKKILVMSKETINEDASIYKNSIKQQKENNSSPILVKKKS